MKKLKLTQAFTLIELIAVMVILLIIASLIVGVGSAARRKALETKAQSMIAALEVAMSMYEADTGEYPADDGGTGCDNSASVTDLTEDPGDKPGQRGPYIEFKDEDIENIGGNDQVVDPWGNPYRYLIMKDYLGTKWGNTNSYNLWSHGSNENDDSYDDGITIDSDYGDDIYNW